MKSRQIVQGALAFNEGVSVGELQGVLSSAIQRSSISNSFKRVNKSPAPATLDRVNITRVIMRPRQSQSYLDYLINSALSNKEVLIGSKEGKMSDLQDGARQPTEPRKVILESCSMQGLREIQHELLVSQCWDKRELIFTYRCASRKGVGRNPITSFRFLSDQKLCPMSSVVHPLKNSAG